mgnify:FL=1
MRFSHLWRVVCLFLLINPHAKGDIIPIEGETTINTIVEYENDTIVLETSEEGRTALSIGRGPGETGRATLINSSITADTSSGGPKDIIVGHDGGTGMLELYDDSSILFNAAATYGRFMVGYLSGTGAVTQNSGTVFNKGGSFYLGNSNGVGY